MRIPLNWRLCLVVFLFSGAGALVGMWLHERMSSPQPCPSGTIRQDTPSGRNFLVIETLRPFEWKS